MSIRNLTEDNDLDLICRTITVKNSDANLTGIYDVNFLNDPLQDFFTLNTIDPTAMLFKSGDFVIVNGYVNITMKVDSIFINPILVLPVVSGYNLYDNLELIAGHSTEIKQNATLSEVITDTSTEIKMAYQETDGTGYVNTSSYDVYYTIRYRLTNF
jgi:hypothetical protein